MLLMMLLLQHQVLPTALHLLLLPSGFDRKHNKTHMLSCSQTAMAINQEDTQICAEISKICTLQSSIQREEKNCHAWSINCLAQSHFLHCGYYIPSGKNP